MNMREIAAQLGVSASSISVVLNNKPGVSNELRSKIEEALIQNGYTLKRNASDDSKKTILFLYYSGDSHLTFEAKDILNAHLNEIEKVCSANNCNLIVQYTRPTAFRQIFDKVEQADGVILFGIEFLHNVVFTRSSCSKPFVILDGYFPESPVDSINVDNHTGLYQAIEYLYRKGHRKIGHIKSKSLWGTLPERWRCFHEVMNYFQLPFCEDHLIEVRDSSLLLQEDINSYLKHAASLPTAFFADNDRIAVAAVNAFQHAGYRVPEDISIVGFDNLDISTLLKPHISTVTMDFAAMAECTVNRLLKLIDNPDLPIIKSSVVTSLVERESVCDINDTSTDNPR